MQKGNAGGICARLRDTVWKGFSSNLESHPEEEDYTSEEETSDEYESEKPTSAQQGAGRIPSNQVYVVHHDAGRAPVTVYTSEGAEVIELPPHYDVSTLNSQTRVEGERRVGPIPRKQSSSQRMNINND